MKFIDFQSLLTGDPAGLALFSTYQFDPDYFERRVLTSPAVQKARRIIVYMDERQWLSLLLQDYPARLVNRRYLLVPVRRPNGVFHPKLSMLITTHSARVLCGSNNLTRAGCSSNLEILNSFDVHADGKNGSDCSLAVEAFAFFRRACNEVEDSVRSLAREWLDDVAASAPWIASTQVVKDDRRFRLVHTYDGSIWGRVCDRLEKDPPKRFMVVSPFFDRDVEMVCRVAKRWPKCRIELVVQQNTTTLNVARLSKLQGRISLSELSSAGRRLHAKIIAWQSSSGAGCLAGSANFTTAALDARNVEACMLIENADSELEALFDRNLQKRTIAFDEFEPGTDNEPEAGADNLFDLRLNAAVLGVDGQLRISYQHRLSPAPKALRVAVRAPGEAHPRLMLSVPTGAQTAVVELPEAALTDANGTLLASLIAESTSGRSESVPIWVVQEARLTYEPSGSGSAPGGSKVEETGEGLPEFIEELGRREGAAAVVEYLRHLNIRFTDGGDGRLHPRPFLLRVRDPFRPDKAPDWLVDSSAEGESLADAIYEFADRHEHKRLRRHGKRGNVNGIENFLDILVALVRLLYIYYMRGVVPRNQFLGRLYRYLRIATAGIDDSEDFTEGYLYTVHENLGRDSAYLKEIDRETRFLSHLWGILLLAQEIRRAGDESVPGRKQLGEYLPSFVAMLNETRRHLSLHAPTAESLTEVLRGYNMLTESQIAKLVNEFLP
jgi:hypothetical protein